MMTCQNSADSHLSGLLLDLCALVVMRSVTRSEPGQPDFTLASGSKTRYYCDTKKVTLSPDGSRLVGQVLYSLLKDNAEAVGGLELGATFIAAAVALTSSFHEHPLYGFTVRDKQKKHGNLEKVAESYHPDGRELLCPGRKVAVVDDVVTEGGSILRAIEDVRARQCDIVAVIALVDRNQGGGDKLRSMGLPYFPLLNACEPGILTVNEAIVGGLPLHSVHTV